jgi:hypothetical protein
MALEAQIITAHLRGGCATEGKRVHLLFVPTSRRTQSREEQSDASISFRSLLPKRDEPGSKSR